MTDFTARVWDNERLFLVDFGRAPARNHPDRRCPDVDKAGYTDDAHAAEHGPIVSCRIGRTIRVRFYRFEISTAARLYAVPDDDAIVQVVRPARGAALPARPATTLHLRPRAVGRAAIEIHYHWPDGPVIGRLYVHVRRLHTVDVRAHIVRIITGTATAPVTNWPGTPFCGQAVAAGAAGEAAMRARITTLVREANKVWDPHGIRLRLRDIALTDWNSTTFGGGAATTQAMRAMATSPNRHSSRINVYFVDGRTLPAGVGPMQFIALGPPVAWAVASGRRWPNTAAGHVGSGIMMMSENTMTISLLAHEFGHCFSLSRIITSGTNRGRALMWHVIGDQAGTGNSHGPATRDDYLTRRRLMYPEHHLLASTFRWRRNSGYGANVRGVSLVQRRLARDITFEESDRAYQYARVNANIYAN